MTWVSDFGEGFLGATYYLVGSIPLLWLRVIPNMADTYA